MLGRETHEIHKAALILAYQEEFEWSMSFVSEKIMDMEGIGLKELPSWFIFLSLTFGKITRSSPLPETLFFLNQFFGLISLLKNSIFVSFPLKHHLNNMHKISNGLQGVGRDDEDWLRS